MEIKNNNDGVIKVDCLNGKVFVINIKYFIIVVKYNPFAFFSSSF